jgi:ferritin-like metal-binding protein YciE
MAQAKTMDDLFLHFLQDIYYAERQIMKALPKMAKAAQADELKQAFMHHREQTQGQIERLQRVFETIGKRARGVTCEALNGLVEESDELMEQFEPGPALDAGLLAGAQAVEHYEIARYGTLKAWALQLGLDEAATLLDATLDQEKKADALLSQLAGAGVNTGKASSKRSGNAA